MLTALVATSGYEYWINLIEYVMCEIGLILGISDTLGGWEGFRIIASAYMRHVPN